MPRGRPSGPKYRAWRDADLARYLYRNYRSKAGARKLAFELTLDWFREKLEPMTCEATGLPLVVDYSQARNNPWGPSIDRIDSSIGYLPDNCRVVCWIYNRAKGAGTDAEVLKMAEALCSS